MSVYRTIGPLVCIENGIKVRLDRVIKRLKRTVFSI